MPSPTTESASPILTYLPRHCSFEPNTHFVDEKVIDHEHHIKPHYNTPPLFSKLKVNHRDLGNLRLLSNLTRVQYGYFHDDPACLITFCFQFQGGVPHHTWRFEKADIRISFQARPPTEDPRDDPVIVDYGPKHLSSTGTDSTKSWWFTGTLSATAATTAPILLGPTAALSAGHNTTSPHHTATEITAADFSDRAHDQPNVVKFWIREDTAQKSRIPMEVDCAVVVKYVGGPFQATVEVKVGPVFDLLATPWRTDDPVVFEPGVEFGEKVREGKPMVDFAALTVEEWRGLVTPDLKLGNAVSDQSRKVE